jgi:hypothetical protein
LSCRGIFAAPKQVDRSDGWPRRDDQTEHHDHLIEGRDTATTAGETFDSAMAVIALSDR